MTLNGGTLMDNFYTQSPVLVLAQSMFEGTDAVVRADAVEDDMERMVKSELPWSEDRRTLARKLTCWYTRTIVVCSYFNS